MSKIRRNWIARGDAIESELARVLAHPLGVAADDVRLAGHALTIRGMVEAEVSEVHVQRFVRTLLPMFGQPDMDAVTSRAVAIALWHVAMAGLVRDRGVRRAEELMRQLPPEPRLGDSLAAALMRAP